MPFSADEYFRLLSENDQAGENYRASFMPDYIYKFICLYDEHNDYDIKENEKRFKSLSENKIWYSLPEKLNDPYEMKGFYFDKDKLIENGYPEETVDVLMNMVLRTPIASFTSNIENNLPMWAHYSNNHKGFAVKYKVNNKHSIRNVIYLDKVFDASKLLSHFYGTAFQLEKTHKNDDLTYLLYVSSVLQMIYFTKHISWKYENEFRALYLDELDSSITHGLNVEADKAKLVPIGVYAGVHCLDEHKTRLKEISGSLGIEFHCCKQSNTEFTVVE